jgi:hypothetical protein
MLTKLIKETLHWARRSVVRHIRSQPTNDAPKSMDDEERPVAAASFPRDPAETLPDAL